MAKDRVCSLGVLALVTGDDEALTRSAEAVTVLAAVIKEQFPERVHPAHMDTPRDAVVAFNDHPDTTFADVERMFEKAELAWDEKKS